MTYFVYLIRTPVPDGGNGQTKHYSRPRQTTVIGTSYEIHGVVWGDAALCIRVVVVGVAVMLSCRVGPRLKELLHHPFVASDLDETYTVRRILLY